MRGRTVEGTRRLACCHCDGTGRIQTSMGYGSKRRQRCDGGTITVVFQHRPVSYCCSTVIFTIVTTRLGTCFLVKLMPQQTMRGCLCGLAVLGEALSVANLTSLSTTDGIGVIAIVVGAVVTIWLGVFRTRKRVSYSVLAAEALRRGMPGLGVTYNTVPIPNPHLCTFLITKAGKPPITLRDYAAPISVSFRPCAHDPNLQPGLWPTKSTTPSILARQSAWTKAVGFLSPRSC